MRYSVIVPCYNVKDYIKDCLDSILAQTYPDWEAICIDDGSPDGLGVILDAYACQDARIKVIHQTNSGVSAARNAGLQHAQGDWIVFLDGDDVLAPWMFELCNKGITKFPEVDMFKFKLKSFGEFSQCTWDGDDRCETFYLNDISHIVDDAAIGGSFCTRVYNRSTMGGIRFRPLIRAQDRLYLIECGFCANSVASCNSAVLGYRQRSSSTVHTPMTYNKLCVEFPFSEIIHNLMETTTKAIDPQQLRHRFNGMTEGIYILWLSWHTADKESRQDVWNRWVALLARAYHFKYIPTFQKIRIGLFLLLPFRVTAEILFRLPHFIKLTGLHR